ncbi:aminopeptidase P family protein [Candidatus Micrarchaeota archaeon]|nr:aminopeptidase P family protein [Candidatus Micrarchaeota archaeon]
MKSRIRRIFSEIDGKCDAALFSYAAVRDYSFFYATGFIGGSFEGSVAVAFPDGNCSAIVPQLEGNTASRENSQNKLQNDLHIYSGAKEYLELMKKELKGVGKLGIDYSALSVASLDRLKKEFSHLKFVDISKEMREVKAVKDEIEIKRIKRAVEIAEKAFERIIDNRIVRIGAMEIDVAAEIGYEMQKLGGTASFPSIVAFGKNAAEPHYSAGNAKLKANEMVLIDWGAKSQRYCSDMTRAFVFGKMSKPQQRMLEVVKDAQEVGFDLMVEGIDAGKVHAAVKEFIDRTEFKGKFIHATGHTIGLQVHDGKGLGGESFELKENMVLTVEPGVYVKGVGGVRLEDDVVVKKNGIEKLSNRNKFFEH